MKTSSGRSVRPVTEPTKCRSCDGDVLWAATESGKWMPVDAEPDNRPIARGGGAWVLTLRGGETGELRVHKYSESQHGDGRNRYTSHFATCPNADEHRRSR